MKGGKANIVVIHWKSLTLSAIPPGHLILQPSALLSRQNRRQYVTSKTDVRTAPKRMSQSSTEDPPTLKNFVAEQRYKCDCLAAEGLTMIGDAIGEILNVKGERNFTLTHQCPPHFDGLLCWPRTVASRTVTHSCSPRGIFQYEWSSPNDSSSFEIDRETSTAVVAKACLADGKWYESADELSKSNYGLCALAFVGRPSTVGFDSRSMTNLIGGTDRACEYGRNPGSLLHDQRWLPIIRIVSQIGYASSLVVLIVAMLVFSLLRKLRNPRNRLHMHLFASFIMRAFMALLKDWIFVDGIGLAWDIVLVDGRSTFIKERDTWVCKTITSMWQYSIVANYSWILMEGLYLHNLIFLALCADTATITLYVVLGWGIPSLVVVPWIIIRATIEDTLCWTTHENPLHFLVIRIPIVVSILLNFLLFVNIVRVLFIKFKRSVHLQRKKMQYSRWARSTLVLVPLFGAHYTLFLGLSYHKDHRVELIWLFCDQLFASFQGSFVALLYCLLNVEVRTEIRRAWKIRRSERDMTASISGHRELHRRAKTTTNSRCDQKREYELPKLVDSSLNNLTSPLRNDCSTKDFRASGQSSICMPT
ncbi:hypothetical protein KM043_018086 [Ampulex compressa]|nr:hypothetical protein KM043_018086 [Ampulex compressa]